MKYLQYLVIYPVLSIIMASGLLFSVFGTGSSSVSDTAQNSISKERTNDAVNDNKNKTLRVKWQGESNLLSQMSNLVIKDKDFVNDKGSDQVDFLIRLAKISAAVSNYSKFALESRKADSSVMEVFWKIEAVSSVGAETQGLYASVKDTLKQKNIRLVEEELRILAEPESVSDLANHDYDNRLQKRQIEAKIDAIQYSLSEDAYAISSSKNILLAISVLLRDAGQKLENAVSENGLVQDEVAYQKAATLVEATKLLKLSENNPYCDLELAKLTNIKNKVEILENKFIRAKHSDKVVNIINAGDIYAMADETLQEGIGTTYATSCSRSLFISQM